MSSIDIIEATKNSITNSTKRSQKQSLAVLANYNERAGLSSLSAFTKSSSRNKSRTNRDMKALERKYGKGAKGAAYLEDINSIIVGSKNSLHFTNITSINLFTSQMNGFTRRLKGGFQSTVNRSINNQITKLQDLLGVPEFNANITLINSVINNANSLASTISDSFDTISNFSISETTAGLTTAFNKSISDLEGLIPKSNPLEDLKFKSLISSTKVNIFNPTKYDFYKRLKGESSTSKYIQTKLPDLSGTPKPNPAILKDTPDAKIITPQLKKDSNVTKLITPLKNLLGIKSLAKPKFLDNLMGKDKKLTSVTSGIKPPTKIPSLPSAGSLINGVSKTAAKPGVIPPAVASSSSVEVKEEKPSGDKSEYGKIVVKENKGGFVEISDETPGNVRKVNLHPSGTYDAKLDNGDAHTKTTGKKVDIVDGNWQVTVFNDNILIVNKDNKIEIREDSFINIHGSENLNVDKEKNTKVGGDVNNDYGANLTEKVNEDCEITIGGNETKTLSGNETNNISGNKKESIGGNLNITVSGNVNITGGKVNISASSSIALSAPSIKLG